MRPLLIGNDDLNRINEIIEFAKKNVFTKERLQRIVDKKESCAGDSKNHTIFFNFGYRCVFSFEEHPIGLCRHLSLSVEKKGMYPAEIAFQEIIKLFGFKTDISKRDEIGQIWLDRESESINIAELVM